MGWAFCGVNDHGQEMGYGVPCTCDEPGCDEQIDRGLAHVCGGMHKNPETCHKYYCEEHLFFTEAMPKGERQLCARCLKERESMSNLNKWSRTTLQEYLEDRGFAVYDTEDTEKLREAVRLNMEMEEEDEGI